MNPLPILSALSATGPIASRAFAPLFVVSFLAANPGICEFCHIPAVVPPESMQWMASPWFVWGVFALAVIEMLADKNPDAQQAIAPAMPWLKSAVAVFISLALVSPDAQELFVGTFAVSGYLSLGMITGGIWVVAAAVGGLTLLLAFVRHSVALFIDDADPEDDTGLRWIASLAEDAWSLGGIVICIALPLVAIVVAALLFVIATIAWRAVRYVENRNRVDCVTAGCDGHPLPLASRCPACRVDMPPVRRLAWSVRKANADTPWDAGAQRDHQLRVLAKQRCPTCAEPATGSDLLKNGCSHCGFRLDGGERQEWFQDYHRRLVRRGWRLLVPLTVVSLVPAIGFAVAIVTLKLALAGPYRSFLGFGTKSAARCSLRLASLLLLIPGSLPGFSVIAVPLLVVLHVAVYSWLARRAFSAMIRPVEAVAIPQ